MTDWCIEEDSLTFALSGFRQIPWWIEGDEQKKERLQNWESHPILFQKKISGKQLDKTQPFVPPRCMRYKLSTFMRIYLMPRGPTFLHVRVRRCTATLYYIGIHFFFHIFLPLLGNYGSVWPGKVAWPRLQMAHLYLSVRVSKSSLKKRIFQFLSLARPWPMLGGRKTSL